MLISANFTLKYNSLVFIITFFHGSSSLALCFIWNMQSLLARQFVYMTYGSFSYRHTRYWHSVRFVTLNQTETFYKTFFYSDLQQQGAWLP